MAPPPGQTRHPTRSRLASGMGARVVVLLAIIIGAGAAGGFALAYPIRHLVPTGSVAVVLDQESLVGTFDASQALVQQSDLTASWQPGDPNVSQLASLSTPTYCNTKVEPTGQLGAPLKRNFVDTGNSNVLFSEVMPLTTAANAKNYMSRVRLALGACKNPVRNRFYQVDDKGVRTEFEIRADRPNPPVSEDSYISRTLQPVGGGTTRVMTYLQAGAVIVALEYQGQPHQIADQMDKIERQILERLVPRQFKKTADVPGAKPLPGDEGPSTTVIDQTKPSPTSTPTPPPTLVVPTAPTAPTTTVRKRVKPKPTTSQPAATTAAPATTPATAAPPPAGQ